MIFNTLTYFVFHVNFKNISLTIRKPVYNTVLYSRFLMERGSNTHVLEFFDKLPRKNVSLSKKQSLLWSALLYGKIPYYMHNLYMINEEYFKFRF